jgi:hypothetical protein
VCGGAVVIVCVSLAIFGWSLWLALSQSVRLSRFLWRQYSLRRAAIDVVMASEHELTGILSWDATGPYLEVVLPSGLTKVRMPPRDLGAFSVFSTRGGDESRIEGSLVLQAPLGKADVAFLSCGRALAMGFRTLLDSKSVIITARHNLATLKSSADVMVASHRNKAMLMDRTWSVVADYPRLDLVAIEFPPDVAAALGVAVASLSATPAAGKPVDVHGYIAGEPVVTKGVVSGTMDQMRVKHTATTKVGFSGAAVYDGGRVVAVHLRGEQSFNVAVSVQFLLPSLESEPHNKAFVRVSADDDWDGRVVFGMRWGRLQKLGFKGRSFLEPQNLDFSYKGPNQAWADYDEEDEWYEETKLETEMAEYYSGMDYHVFGKGSGDETAQYDSAEVLKALPVVLAALRASNSANTDSSPESASPVAGAVLTPSVSTAPSPPPEKLSKGQRQRRNRAAAKLATISGHPATLPPVNVPSLSTPEVSSTLPPPPQSTSTKQSMSSSCQEGIHAPLSRRDLARLRHLLDAYEQGCVPLRETSRTKLEWSELWDSSPWIVRQGCLSTN